MCDDIGLLKQKECGLPKIGRMVKIRFLLDIKKFSFCSKKIFLLCCHRHVYLPLKNNFCGLKIPLMTENWS